MKLSPPTMFKSSFNLLSSTLSSRIISSQSKNKNIAPQQEFLGSYNKERECVAFNIVFQF